MYGYTTSNVYDIRSFIATNESFRPLRARSHVTSAIFQMPMQSMMSDAPARVYAGAIKQGHSRRELALWPRFNMNGPTFSIKRR